MMTINCVQCGVEFATFDLDERWCGECSKPTPPPAGHGTCRYCGQWRPEAELHQTPEFLDACDMCHDIYYRGGWG